MRFPSLIFAAMTVALAAGTAELVEFVWDGESDWLPDLFPEKEPPFAELSLAGKTVTGSSIALFGVAAISSGYLTRELWRLR